MAKARKSRKSVSKTSSTAQQQVLETMHQIWLAGLGALSKARSGAPQLLDELVAEGARVHAATRGSAEQALVGLVGGVKAGIDSRVSQMRRQAGDALDNMEDIFQARVQQVLNQIGVPSASDIESLGKRVDMLSSSINKIARERGSNVRRLHVVGRSPASSHAAAS